MSAPATAQFVSVQSRIAEIRSRFVPPGGPNVVLDPAAIPSGRTSAPSASMVSQFESLLASNGVSAPAATMSASQARTSGPTVGDQVVEELRSHLGKPYVWGATGPDSFDCSGLVKYVFNKFGVNPPRVSNQQAEFGERVNGIENARPGDVISFLSPGAAHAGPNGVGHVGIYIGNGQMIHAPGRGKQVRIDGLEGRKIYSIQRFAEAGAAPGATPAASSGTPAAASVAGQPGGRTLVVGDSLTVGSRDAITSALRAQGRTVTVDALSGRSARTAAAPVAAFAPGPTDTVVVALGTNDMGSPATVAAAVERVMASAGQAKVQWVNVDAAGGEAVNAVLAEAAGRYRNLEVLDWQSHARRAGLSRADGVHYDRAGYDARAAFLAQRLPPTTASAPATPSAPYASSAPVSLGASVGGFFGPQSTAAVSGVPFAELFNSIGARHGVSPTLLAAVASTESGFNPSARSSAGASGLMQFMPATARGMGVDASDPSSSIDGAARYLKSNFERFGTVELALAAYNAGPGAVSRHGGVPPYRETQNYIVKVLDRANGRAPMR